VVSSGLEDFKPLCHQLHKGRYMSAFFACAHCNGKNYLLKKYDKRELGGLGVREVQEAV
jgi:hypothetical protein